MMQIYNLFSIMQAKHKINSNYFQNIFTFQKKGYFCGTKRDRMSEKVKVGRGMSGRPPLFNEVAPNGFAACSLVIRVSREDYARWNDYKARLAAETPGVIPTNDEAFARLIETIRV